MYTDIFKCFSYVLDEVTQMAPLTEGRKGFI